MANERPERSEIEDMLPWHAVGALDERDTQRVKAALAADLELARRFAIVREEHGEAVHLNEALGVPSNRAKDRLFALIDTEPARPGQTVRQPGAIARFFSGFSARSIAWAASAAVVLIVLQAGVITRLVLQTPEDEGGYRSVELSAPTVRGSYVLIRFAPQASAADITKFLDTHQATVVDGPKPGGLYRVRVASNVLSRDELARVVRDLQGQSAIVSFAAPSE